MATKTPKVTAWMKEFERIAAPLKIDLRRHTVTMLNLTTNRRTPGWAYTNPHTQKCYVWFRAGANYAAEGDAK